jgi:hypothetical protein
MKERREAGEGRPRKGDATRDAAGGEPNVAAGTDERIAGDLAALRSVRSQDLPSLDETVRAAQRLRPDPGLEPNGIRRILMQALGFIRTRPLVATAAAALVLVIASMIPVSYDRVTGHNVALTISGDGVSMEQVAGAAKDMKARLGAESVSVRAEAGNAGTAFVLSAIASERSRSELADATSGFVRELAQKGIRASVSLAPHTERVRYPVVAYAWDQMIQISVDGKSASQLESEIKQRLAEAGVADAQVSVTDVPDGGRNVSLRVERLRTGDDPTAVREEPMPTLVLTKDGAPLAGGDAVQVKVQKRKTQDGAVTLVADIAAHGKTATVEIPNTQNMSDMELQNALSTKLREQGLNLSVTVTNGAIRIEPVK